VEILGVRGGNAENESSKNVEDWNRVDVLVRYEGCVVDRNAQLSQVEQGP
jgi:hypothetical protein